MTLAKFGFYIYGILSHRWDKYVVDFADQIRILLVSFVTKHGKQFKTKLKEFPLNLQNRSSVDNTRTN